MSSTTPSGNWPKVMPELSQEQQHIRDDFMKHWLEVLPQRFGIIEKFNQGYPLRTFKPGTKTLEIGAGIGAHLNFENLEEQEYVALELRQNVAAKLQANFPQILTVVGDCQEHIDFPDGYFDRVLAIHLLEHLPNLPKALAQIQRVLSPTGQFSVVIPCEGGIGYTLARNVSARPIFEKRYKQSYDWFVASEHVNLPNEIIQELLKRFVITHRSYFPFLIPVTTTNLVIGLTLKLRVA